MLNYKVHGTTKGVFTKLNKFSKLLSQFTKPQEGKV